ncbi:hypothetical protein Taro_004254, partial [Colocasia esculenta]|nr:hypothetical protein [Colocasia esculenta]
VIALGCFSPHSAVHLKLLFFCNTRVVMVSTRGRFLVWGWVLGGTQGGWGAAQRYPCRLSSSPTPMHVERRLLSEQSMSSSTQVGVVLVEEEEAELVDPVDANSALFSGSIVVKRLGRFLKPRAATPQDTARLPLVQPLLREVISAGLVKEWPAEVLFCGWCCTSPRWDQWVCKMRSLHGRLWLESGIHEAVAASTFRFRRDDALLFGLLECWCPETSSFVLPWPSTCVEATITLEDVMIMGGFPVLGEPVGPTAPPPAGEAGELLEELGAELRRLMGRRPHRISNAEWMDHHMESQAGGGGSPLEHAAFLTMWLSMFVFPGASVRRNLLPIAARLATGKRVALAPAVLASFYRDLRLMKQQTLAEGISNEGTPITVWAPFHILQLWARERFRSLRPEKTPHFLRMNEPRAARWRCCDASIGDLSTVRSVLWSPAEFRWRPYADNVDTWGRPSYYRQVSRWYSVSAGDDLSLASLLRCLRAGELLGLDCVERYAPHRVAMQFGLDQDLPAQIPWTDANWELIWMAYDRGREKAKLYVPSQFCKPHATDRFLKWQKEWMAARMVEVEKIAVEQEDDEVSKGQEVNGGKRHHSTWTDCISGEPTQKATTAAASAGEQLEFIAEDGNCMGKKIQNDVDGEAMELEKSNGDEALIGKQFNSSSRERAEVPLRENCRDDHTEKETQKKDDYKPTEIDGEARGGNKLNSNFWKNTVHVRDDHGLRDYEQLEQSILQELEEVDLSPKTEKKEIVLDVEFERQKDMEFEREVLQLKAEIAALEEQLKNLQSEADMETSGSEEDEDEGKIIVIE